jgi:hypothetical protein
VLVRPLAAGVDVFDDVGFGVVMVPPGVVATGHVETPTAR